MVKPPKAPSGRGIPLHADAIEYWAGQQKKLRRNLPRWNQFRSSLDAVRQTHRAIEAYNHSNGDLTEDQRYLAIYGLLQALVVQQDAMCHLSEALQTKPVHMNRHKRLEEIRNIRNWTVGHPTKVDRYETHSHHAIQRPQLGRGGFSLYSAFDDGREQYTYVPLLQLARLQRRVVSRLLREMLRELNSRERKPAVAHAAKSKPALPSQPPLHGQQPSPPGQQVGKPAKPNRRRATTHISEGRESWVSGQSLPESRMGGTLGRPRPSQPKRGLPAQKPPQFAPGPMKKRRLVARPSALLPLPGEKFARHRPAA